MLLLLACKGDPSLPATPSTVETGESAPVDSAPASGRLRISEVVADASDGDDWFELWNPGPDAVDLEGWTISDRDEGGRALSAQVLVPGEFVVFSADGEDFALSKQGEALWLWEPDGALADTLSFPALSEDVSYGLSMYVESTTLVGDGSEAEFALSPEGARTPVVLPVGFDGPGSTTSENLALFQPTTQSTDGYGRTGAQAVDGELATFSHTNLGDLDPWWEVDLGGAMWVESVTLYNRLDCCRERLYNLTVSLSDDAGAVYTSEVLNPVDSPSDPGDLEVSVAATGHTLRVSKEPVGGTNSSEWLTFAEVVVTGSESAPYSEWIGTDVGDVMRDVSDEGWVFAEADLDGDRAVLTIQIDDGFVAWMGEHEVASRDPDDLGTVEVLVDPGLDGPLVIQGINEDDDFLVRPTLVVSDIEVVGEGWFVEPTPGEPNGLGLQGAVEDVQVSVERGFLDEATSIRVWTETPGATLVYTLDGSRPTAENGIAVSGEVTLEVSETTTLRAFAYAEDRWDSEVVAHSWIFLDQVIEQPAAPEGFPATWDGISQSAVGADYEMDPEVVEAYREELLAGLRDIPTMSIQMDPEDLFGADAGIYVHSLQRGSAWEREASIELILPDGSTGFSEHAGLKVHGYGWRYHSNTKKHALRLEFRPEYGESKLEYPLFADAPVDRFDSIVLRCQGSRSWQDFRDPAQAQYIRDAFARDTARDMGKVDGHATYVHLYLNGLYWGLYMPVERPDAGFGEEYFGGSDADYDAINRRTTTNEAIDGTLDAYNEMLAMADAGLSTPEDWLAIQEVLDVVDLVDYMLIHQYTVNLDGPEIFSSNNMRGVRNREGGLWRFFVWDMEYSLWTPEMNYNIEVDVAGSISHVYAALRDNAEFRALYSERATEHLTGEGALTPDAAIARYEARATEIERAIVGESARWGDTDRSTPYTRDVEWAEERRRLVEEFFPTRTEQLIAQLQAAGLME